MCERVTEIKETVDRCGSGIAKNINSSLKYNEIDIEMLSFKRMNLQRRSLVD